MIAASFWYKRTTLLSVFFSSVLAGVAAAKLTGGVSIMLVAVFCIFAGICRNKQLLLQIVSLVALGMVIGIWRGGIYLDRIEPYKQLAGQKVSIVAVADSSGVYGQNSQLEFDIAHIKIMSPLKLDLPGRMVVSGYGVNSVLRGDTVTSEGKIYLRRGGKQAGISYATINVTKRSASVIEKLRRDFLAGLSTSLPEPHDQFAAGLLIGQKSELPASVTETLRIVGLSHVIAVSGYNLTILVDVARKRMGKKSKFRATVSSILLILLFVALAGSSASIARAAFVSILTVLASHYGRSVKPVLLILLAASCTAFINPLNVWTDIGWYLSFFAFFGVLVVAPAVQKRIYGLKKEPHVIAKILLETGSAQIMTLPIIMFVFGEISLVSMVANILVVPLVPLAMLLSLVAGIAGMVLPLASGIFAWPARVILDFMLSVSSILSRIPHAFKQATISAYTMTIAYVFVVILVIVMHQKAKTSDTITE